MNRPTLFALSCALAVGVAYAPKASAQVTFPVVLLDTKYSSLSKLDCLASPQETINFAFTWSVTLLAGEDEEVFASRSSSCSDTTTGTPPDALILRARKARTLTTGKFPQDNSSETLDARLLFDFIAPDCGGPAGVDTTIYLCVNIFVPQSLTVLAVTNHGSVPIHLDSVPPATPTGVTADALDSGLSIAWTMPTDLAGTARYFVHVVGPDGVDKGTGVAGSAATSTKISGLVNGTPYTVTVNSIDASGTKQDNANPSLPSAPVTGTPAAVNGFYELYRADGGTDQGGCTSAPASLVALLAAAGLLMRRRRGAALAALTVALTLPAVARAQQVGPAWSRSPRHYTFSIRTGPYSPSVDSEAGLKAKGSTPYATVFGTGTPLLWRAEFDFDLLTKIGELSVGRLSVGVAGGFWQAVGKGRFAADPTKTANDTILLNLWPVTPLLTYRADFIFERWGIPLVPFAKLGYGFTRWSSYKDGSLSKVGADSALGWARGVEYGAGLQFVLDAIEPDKAASLDQDFGINSTSLFAEFDGVRWEGAGGLLLHGTSFNGGLLLAF